MSCIFGDGFDNYSVISDVYEFTGSDNSIRLNTGQSRTGIGCLQINSAAFGPTKTFTGIPHVLGCTNWNCNTGGQVLAFSNFLADVGQNAWCVVVAVNLDGSISITRGPSASFAVLGTTVANLYHFNTYNNIACEVVISPSAGVVNLWVNGALKLALTNVNTGHANQGVANICDGIQLMAPGGIPTCFHDDFYILDCGSTPNNTFLGALKLYTLAPTANASVTWTPNAGTNWSNVSEIPPDGDTSFNSSSTVNQVDQYVYPATGVPAGSSIFFVLHDQDLKIGAAGSRSVGSVINGGAPVNSQALTSNYHIYQTSRDTSDGINQWTLGNFPLNAGPQVTL